MTRGSAVTLVTGWVVVLVVALAVADPTHTVLLGWMAAFCALPLYYLGTLIPTWFHDGGDRDSDPGDDPSADEYEPVDEDGLPGFWERHTWCDPLLRRALGLGLALAWVLVVIHLQSAAGVAGGMVGLVLGLGSIPVCLVAIGVASGRFESKRAKYARLGRPASFWKRHPWLDAILGD